MSKLFSVLLCTGLLLISCGERPQEEISTLPGAMILSASVNGQRAIG